MDEIDSKHEDKPEAGFVDAKQNNNEAATDEEDQLEGKVEAGAEAEGGVRSEEPGSFGDNFQLESSAENEKVPDFFEPRMRKNEETEKISAASRDWRSIGAGIPSEELSSGFGDAEKNLQRLVPVKPKQEEVEELRQPVKILIENS